MKHKTRLFASASSLVMATSMMVIAAPAAHAATQVGACAGQVWSLNVGSYPRVVGVGITDQTAPVKTTGNLASVFGHPLMKLGGNCSGVTRSGDRVVPYLGPLATLTPTSATVSLLGNASCAIGATAQGVDANTASAYQVGGYINWTFSQTYTPLVSPFTPRHYKMKTQIAMSADPLAGPDVFDVGGIGLTGVNFNAVVSGTIWQDPVTYTHGLTGYNTGYELDLATAANCADGTPNNANIVKVLDGGGGGTATSLLGSTASGLVFTG